AANNRARLVDGRIVGGHACDKDVGGAGAGKGIWIPMGPLTHYDLAFECAGDEEEIPPVPFARHCPTKPFIVPFAADLLRPKLCATVVVAYNEGVGPPAALQHERPEPCQATERAHYVGPLLRGHVPLPRRNGPCPAVLGATPAPRPQQLPLGGVAGDEGVLPPDARERGSSPERGRLLEAACEKDLSLRERIHVHAARRIVPGAPDLLHPHEVACGVVPR